jgi:hypothetical protein
MDFHAVSLRNKKCKTRSAAIIRASVFLPPPDLNRFQMRLNYGHSYDYCSQRDPKTPGTANLSGAAQSSTGRTDSTANGTI